MRISTGNCVFGCLAIFQNLTNKEIDSITTWDTEKGKKSIQSVRLVMTIKPSFKIPVVPG